MKLSSFLLDAISSEKVLGLGVGSSLEKVKESLGSSAVLDRKRKLARLDAGLVEFNFFSGVCESFAIQVHRLARGPVGSSGEVFGGVASQARTVKFAELCVEMKERGAPLLAESESSSDYRYFKSKNSRVSIVVFNGADSFGSRISCGDVWSVQISGSG